MDDEGCRTISCMAAVKRMMEHEESLEAAYRNATAFEVFIAWLVIVVAVGAFIAVIATLIGKRSTRR